MYRIYFNKRCPSGLIWSVDKGTQETEVNVRKVVTRNVRTYTDSGPGDNLNSPTVWIVVEGGNLQILDDIAYIMPEA